MISSGAAWFSMFYGLDHLRRMAYPLPEGQQRRALRIHIGGFTAYVALMSYLLVHSLEEALYRRCCTSWRLQCTFWVSIRNARRARRRIRACWCYALAGACMLGWGLGMAVRLGPVVAMLVAFVSEASS
jgi:hypothetical protein